MKKFYTFVLALLIASAAVSQTDDPCESCLPEGITFTTQSQIDSFPINYPNCTEIEGEIIINTEDINSLSGLSNITSIGGGVTINYALITSFEGLENLTEIDGELWIKFTSLDSFEGLNNLNSIGGDFSIGQNDFTSFDGLDNLTSIGGDFSVWDNGELSSLDGLESLLSIDGNLQIGGIWDGNPVLISIYGLENVSNIGSDLYIQGNSQLSVCAIQSICDYLAAPNGDIYIESNALGCTNTEEVVDSCEAHAGLIDAQITANKLLIYPNPSHSNINIELPSQPSKNAFLTILNTQGQQLISQSITEPKTEINISVLPAGIYIVRIWDDEGVMMGKVVVE